MTPSQPGNASSTPCYSWRLVLPIIIAIGLMFLMPPDINPGLDFSQFYADLFGILRGDAIYNQLSHSLHYAEATLTRPLKLNPPAYPPWYYVFFLPLGALDILTSARVWALLNIAMLGVALTLLTERLTRYRRAALIVLWAVFTPVIGHLVVGQQTILLLTGLALLLNGLERQSSPATTIGLVLLSFKPHLGIPVAAASLVWVLWRNSPLAVSTLVRLLAAGILLALLSLLLDSHSLVDYPESLQRLSALSLNQACDTCSSLPITLQRILPAGESPSLWSSRFLISLVLAVLFAIPLFVTRLPARTFLAGSVCVTLLCAPYIRNYDYVLLLFPLTALMEESLIKSRLKKVRSKARFFLCLGAYGIAGIMPLLLSRESHQYTLWISALLAYLACFTGRTAKAHRAY